MEGINKDEYDNLKRFIDNQGQRFKLKDKVLHHTSIIDIIPLVDLDDPSFINYIKELKVLDEYLIYNIPDNIDWNKKQIVLNDRSKRINHLPVNAITFFKYAHAVLGSPKHIIIYKEIYKHIKHILTLDGIIHTKPKHEYVEE